MDVRKRWLAGLLLALLAEAIFLFRLSVPHIPVFDEVHYLPGARAAGPVGARQRRASAAGEGPDRHRDVPVRRYAVRLAVHVDAGGQRDDRGDVRAGASSDRRYARVRSRR
ncbi:hypothetical protein AB5I41_03585 [Sphingomonas sp. MMS24-JH45]